MQCANLFLDQAAVWRERLRLRRLFLRFFVGTSSVGGSEGVTEGVSKRKASHHPRGVRSSLLVSAARRRYAMASPNSDLPMMEAGRRGGIRCREACRARMARSRPPTRTGMETVWEISFMNRAHAASSACWWGMPSRWLASAASCRLGPKNAARKSAGDAGLPLRYS